MCFGPSRAEKEAAAQQRVEADFARREELEKRAKKKREDISDALDARRSGSGRRSLFRASGQGFLGRFS